MGLLDQARQPKPQEDRKDADFVIGSKDDIKGAGYEAVCTGIYHKASDYNADVMNVYVTGELDDGKTVLVLGHSKVLREEIAASGLTIGQRFAVVFQDLVKPKGPGKPYRLYRFVVEPAAGASDADSQSSKVPF